MNSDTLVAFLLRQITLERSAPIMCHFSSRLNDPLALSNIRRDHSDCIW